MLALGLQTAQRTELVIVVYTGTPCLPAKGVFVSVDSGTWTMTDSVGIARFLKVVPGPHRIEARAVGGARHFTAEIPAGARYYLMIDLAGHGELN